MLVRDFFESSVLVIDDDNLLFINILTGKEGNAVSICYSWAKRRFLSSACWSLESAVGENPLLQDTWPM